MPERALIYGRASQDRAHAGTSVTKQLERGRTWCEHHGHTITAEVRDDNRSASRGSKARPGFLTVRAAIENGETDHLVLWEVSRSSRDLEEFMSLVNACADNAVAIVVSGTAYDARKVDDWLPLVFQGVMAEAEARRIRQRNVDSVATNARRGTPHGRLPYGYRRVYDSKTGLLQEQTPYVRVDASGTPVRDPDGGLIPVRSDAGVARAFSPEAQVLIDATRDVLAGRTLRSICRDLNTRGVPSPRKPRARTLAENPAGAVEVWTIQSLRQRLLNPTIAGRRVHQGTDIGPAAWDPILEYGRWLKLRGVLTDPSRLAAAPRGPQPRHLLSQIALCGECGARMKATRTMHRMPRAYACRHEGCMKITVSAPRVEELVEDVLRALFARDGFRKALTDAYRRRETRTTSGPDVADLIAAAEAEYDEVEALRAAGEMTVRAYAAETKRIEEALGELRNRTVAGISSPVIRKLLSASDLWAGYEEFDLLEKREVIRVLLRVTVKRATTKGRRFDVDRVVIEPTEFLATGQID